MKFLSDEARGRGQSAVGAFEEKTSAELVLSVKKESSPHAAASLGFGLLLAFISLLVLLFHPYEFDTRWMPLDLLVAFGIGFGFARSLAPVRRIFLLPSARARAATAHAKALFHDLGISKTTGRSGVLLVASLLERKVTFVFDVGIPNETRALAEEKVAALEEALRRDDFEAYASVIEALGEPFSAALPRQEGDVNELSDEVA